MAQQAQQQQGKQGLVPNTKSPGESQAVVAMMQAQGNPDGMIKAADELVQKYSDSFYKELALWLEANAYQQKGDVDKAQIYAEQVVQLNPKHLQAPNMLGGLIVHQTKENDLDKDEKLAKAEKYFNMTLDTLKTAQKPNPQLPDQQWEEAKKSLAAEAHAGLGSVASFRKKPDVMQTEFRAAAELDPAEPKYQVQLASALLSAGKNEEAAAVCDKVLANPQLHPQIKQVAQNIKAQATKK
jgi:tetratricopeptide (TPR) repeat protein